MLRCRLYLLGAAIFAGGTVADPNDFVNPKYVAAARGDPITKDARSTIIRQGDLAAKKGPWTVTDSQVRASSNDPHDYLSWAPYHWPNCNWCSARASSADQKSSSDAHDDSAEVHTADEDSDERLLGNSPDSSPATGNPFTPLYAGYRRGVDWSDLFPEDNRLELAANLINTGSNTLDPAPGHLDDLNGKELLLGAHEGHPWEPPSLEANGALPRLADVNTQLLETTTILAPISQATAVTEDHFSASLIARDSHEVLADTVAITDMPMPTIVAPTAPEPPLPTTQSETTTSGPDGVYNHSEYPMRAHKPSKTTGCQPSPTTSMAPSETWKTCPYKPRDGRVNPDVRKLKNAAEVVDMSQAVLWNAVAFVSSGSDLYAGNAASFINKFFLNDKTRMNPHVIYGQVVRGPPGTQGGTYMGVLDMRGMVKVVNSVLVLRDSKSQYWTPDMDAKMISWASQYVKWVESSEAGKKAARAANNHGSFYPNQIAALKILAGDIPGAKVVLQSYFANQFQEQVPLEAVRTRPFHYRCFNLEAIITNAKLGDYIGANFWDYRSKYGATIQTAVNYVMSLDPHGEKIEEALPHVAAAAAVYGDPQGKYARYLKNGNRNYMKKPFWFYDQPDAISRSASKAKIGARDGSPAQAAESNIPASEVDQDHPPPLFSDGRLVELEEGLFVDWEDVRDFYRKRRIPGERRRTRVKQLVSRQAPAPEPIPSMFQDRKEVELEEGIDVSWEDVEHYYKPSPELS